MMSCRWQVLRFFDWLILITGCMRTYVHIDSSELLIVLYHNVKFADQYLPYF
jgi:hypothetical protein